MRVEAPPLGGREVSADIQNLEPITPAFEGGKISCKNPDFVLKFNT